MILVTRDLIEIASIEIGNNSLSIKSDLVNKYLSLPKSIRSECGEGKK